jgi:NAD(P)-dependent dehydrogenase (short-subunit alcohol dehydrogenase family)
VQQSETPSLKGSHAAVTGGGSGIGAAAARELARQGARVTLMGRSRERLDAVAKAIAAAGGTAAVEPVDVTESASVASAFASAAARLGPLSILVNNAGAAESAPFARTGLDLLERMLRVNLTGAFLCTQAALPAMLAARSGRIVSVASTAGLRGYAYVAAYCAAKHGLVGMTRALALEIARSGITANAVCPGYTETELLDRAVANIVAKTGRSADAARAELAAINPMGRLVKPEEVAATIAFLCSPAAASITGEAIAVAGGEVTS